MNLSPFRFAMVSIALAVNGFAQDFFQFDQQSDTSTLNNLALGALIQANVPIGQSFTPSLPAVSFIMLKLNDGAPGGTGGATLWLNLRTESIGGPVIGTTEPLTLADGYSGVATFRFNTAVSLTPESTYFFDVQVSPSSDPWKVVGGPYNYPGGTEIFGGTTLRGGDLWFREGLAVPEPSTALLFVVGAVWIAVGGCRLVSSQSERRVTNIGGSPTY